MCCFTFSLIQNWSFFKLLTKKIILKKVLEMILQRKFKDSRGIEFIMIKIEYGKNLCYPNFLI